MAWVGDIWAHHIIGKQNKQEVGQEEKALRPTPSDPLSPVRFDFPKIPQPHRGQHQLGTKCSDIRESLLGAFAFKIITVKHHLCGFLLTYLPCFISCLMKIYEIN